MQISLESVPLPAMLLDASQELLDCNMQLQKILEHPVLLDGLSFGPLAPEELGTWLLNQPDTERELLDSAGNCWVCRTQRTEDEDYLLVLQQAVIKPRQEAPLSPGDLQSGWQVPDSSAAALNIVSRLRKASRGNCSIPELLALMHSELQFSMLAPNMFVAIHNREWDSFSFPYWKGSEPAPEQDLVMNGSLIEQVMLEDRRIMLPAGRASRPVSAELFAPLSVPAAWIGLPIRSGSDVIGVLVLHDEDALEEPDAGALFVLELLCDFLGLLISREETRRQLEESTAQYMNITAHFEDGLCVLDGKGRLMYSNPALLSMLGLSVDATGCRLAEIMVHNERFKFDVYLRRICRGEKLSFELSMPDSQGQDRNILVSSGPCGAINGRDTFFLTFSDISGIRRTEAEKLRLMEQILGNRHLERLGTFAGGISHEFNNILQVIRANAEMALLSPTEHGLSAELSEIIQSTARAGNLVQQLLTFSRQGHEIRKEYRLSGIIESVLQSSLFSREQLELIEFRKNCSDDLVLVDEMQMELLVRQLLDNALRSLRENGRVRIMLSDAPVEMHERLAGGISDKASCLLLQIEDNGTGIRGEDIDRIFDPFFTTRLVGQGLGMGLSMAHGIVSSHNGAIWASPARGGGTIFNVLLERFVRESALARDSSRSGKPLVLLVDDEEILLRLGRRLLSRIGMDVVTTSDYLEACEMLRTRADDFALLITDMNLPGGDGINIARLARECNPAMRIMLCTGYTPELDEPSLSEAGVDCVVAKPFEIHELSRMVIKLLSETQPSRDSGFREGLMGQC